MHKKKNRYSFIWLIFFICSIIYVSLCYQDFAFGEEAFRDNDVLCTIAQTNDSMMPLIIALIVILGLAAIALIAAGIYKKRKGSLESSRKKEPEVIGKHAKHAKK